VAHINPNEPTKTETRCPEIPKEVDDFSLELADLLRKHSIQEADVGIRIDTGYGSPYEQRIKDGELIQSKMNVHVSLKDGRGRPRTQIRLNSDIQVQRFVVREPKLVVVGRHKVSS